MVGNLGAALTTALVAAPTHSRLGRTGPTTNIYEHKIPKGKFGNAKYVSWGKRVAWKKKKERLDCTVAVLSKRVIEFPGKKEGWFYWETKN